MAALPGVRALLNLRHSVRLQHGLGLINTHSRSACLSRKLCTDSTKTNEVKLPMNKANESLLENLNLMGVDLEKACERQPGVFRKAITNEQGLAQFLRDKGASQEVIAGIVSRYPRAITRSLEHLEQRWEMWRNIFLTDAEIVSILNRSPESFFRSSDNGNLQKNIQFLLSLGLNTKDLYRMLTTAPRTFSNSVELNMQMVKFLTDTCAELGGENPGEIVKAIITRNLYILIQSTKRIKKNMDFVKESLQLTDAELLALIQGSGAKILDLSNDYLKNNFIKLQEMMIALDCRRADLKNLVMTYPTVLFIGSSTLSSKLDCLLNAGITIDQIIETPRVLDYSTKNLAGRLEDLKKVGFDLQKKGIHILDSSRKRFLTKIAKLSGSDDGEM